MKKLISCILTIIFFQYQIFFNSYDLFANNIVEKKYQLENSTINLDEINLPHQLGEIKDIHNVHSNKIIFFIQDSHCNYFAQKKIAEIIKFLNKKYKTNIVNLEGGVRDYDMSIFHNIENIDLREKVLDYFVKEGTINAGEYFASLYPDKVTLWGVEKEDLYLHNLNAYKDFLKNKDEVEKQIEKLGKVLNLLKIEIYDSKLLEFELKKNAYRKNSMDFDSYMEYLMNEVEKRGINLIKNSELEKIKQLKIKRENIDFFRANTERYLIVSQLEKRLSKTRQKLLYKTSSDFRDKKISENEFNLYLLNEIEILGIDLNRFPQMLKYLDYVRTYEKIDEDFLNKTILNMENLLINSFLITKEQKDFYLIIKNFNLVSNMFNLSFRYKEHMYYKKNKEHINFEKYGTQINELLNKYNIEDVDIDYNIINRAIEKILVFYEDSLKRDKVFIENMKFNKDTEEGQNTNIGIFIAGGFHRENLCNLFKENEISYVSIIPNFEHVEEYKNNYFHLLSGGKNNFINSISINLSAVMLGSLFSKLNISLTDKEALRLAVIALTSMYEDNTAKAFFIERESINNYVLFDFVEGNPICKICSKDQLPEKVDIIIEKNIRKADIGSIYEAFSEIGQDRLIKDSKRHTFLKKDNSIISSLTNLLEELGLNDLKGQLSVLSINKIKNKEEYQAEKIINVDLLMERESAISIVRGLGASHAGGQGIYLREKNKNGRKLSEKEYMQELLHELLAGNYGAMGHDWIKRLETAILNKNRANIKFFLTEGKYNKYKKPIWQMTKEERSRISEKRDFADSSSVTQSINRRSFIEVLLGFIGSIVFLPVTMFKTIAHASIFPFKYERQLQDILRRYYFDVVQARATLYLSNNIQSYNSLFLDYRVPDDLRKKFFDEHVKFLGYIKNNNLINANGSIVNEEEILKTCMLFFNEQIDANAVGKHIEILKQVMIPRIKAVNTPRDKMGIIFREVIDPFWLNVMTIDIGRENKKIYVSNVQKTIKSFAWGYPTYSFIKWLTGFIGLQKIFVEFVTNFSYDYVLVDELNEIINMIVEIKREGKNIEDSSSITNFFNKNKDTIEQINAKIVDINNNYLMEKEYGFFMNPMQFLNVKTYSSLPLDFSVSSIDKIIKFEQKEEKKQGTVLWNRKVTNRIRDFHFGQRNTKRKDIVFVDIDDIETFVETNILPVKREEKKYCGFKDEEKKGEAIYGFDFDSSYKPFLDAINEIIEISMVKDFKNLDKKNIVELLAKLVQREEGDHFFINKILNKEDIAAIGIEKACACLVSSIEENVFYYPLFNMLFLVLDNPQMWITNPNIFGNLYTLLLLTGKNEYADILANKALEYKKTGSFKLNTREEKKLFSYAMIMELINQIHYIVKNQEQENIKELFQKTYTTIIEKLKKNTIQIDYVEKIVFPSICSGLIGKLYDNTEQQAEPVNNIQIEIRANNLYLSNGTEQSNENFQLYDKYGTEVSFIQFNPNPLNWEEKEQFLSNLRKQKTENDLLTEQDKEVLEQIITSIEKQEIYILEKNPHNILGLSYTSENDNRIFLDPRLVSDIAIFHETGEMVLAENPNYLSEGVNAHVYLRGIGKKVQINQPLNENSSLQEKIFGIAANDVFTKKISIINQINEFNKTKDSALVVPILKNISELPIAERKEELLDVLNLLIRTLNGEKGLSYKKSSSVIYSSDILKAIIIYLNKIGNNTIDGSINEKILGILRLCEYKSDISSNPMSKVYPVVDFQALKDRQYAITDMLVNEYDIEKHNPIAVIGISSSLAKFLKKETALDDVETLSQFISRMLGKLGYGTLADPKKIITFIIERENKKKTKENMEQVLEKIKDEQRNIVLFVPEMKNKGLNLYSDTLQDGVKYIDYIKQKYVNIIIIPDAYTDSSMVIYDNQQTETILLPDLKARYIISRIVDWYKTGTDKGKEQALYFLNRYIKTITKNENIELKDIEDFLQYVLEIRPIDYKGDISQWQKEQKKVDKSL